jgi:serine/threonine protein kinase
VAHQGANEFLLLLLLLRPRRYHDCFMDDVYINIVMEYCNAGDLTGLLKQRAGQRLPEPEIMSLFVQVGLCWAQSVIHLVLCARLGC